MIAGKTAVYLLNSYLKLVFNPSTWNSIIFGVNKLK